MIDANKFEWEGRDLLLIKKNPHASKICVNSYFALSTDDLVDITTAWPLRPVARGISKLRHVVVNFGQVNFIDSLTSLVAGMMR